MMSGARDRLKLVVATCFGLGYSPFFPGTCGALIGVAIFVPIALWLPPVWQPPAIGLALLIHYSRSQAASAS